MSRIWAKFAGMLSNRSLVGVDKTGNRYFTRKEEIDGFMKEKRWVVFKGEHDPTSIPVEWICWLNGQRKSAPTSEEMAELDARRERLKLNVARMKEEEERLAREGKIKKSSVGKLAGPDLKHFVGQFTDASKGYTAAEPSNAQDESRQKANVEESPHNIKEQPESSEPSGSGESFRPGTWQPPS
ncbi:unnamed protein product [Cuscuta epithymum]|uniref:NADH dehydrogenase [ubiquinone] 1 alpha subcomplex subunit 12 n=1 Tax=Cuscuta epithymum TaxID=186058 RepID=A0AAV0EBQ9_9ASTE|nr:unnamed protein product [Cuscuta epithymum]CAH9119962.1 unnamed protein product [Cuscuta epithymum]